MIMTWSLSSKIMGCTCQLSNCVLHEVLWTVTQSLSLLHKALGRLYWRGSIN